MFVEGSEGWCLDDFLLFFFSPLSPWWSTTDRFRAVLLLVLLSIACCFVCMSGGIFYWVTFSAGASYYVEL